MAKKGLRFPKKALKKADRELKDLMLKVIKTKKGGTTVKGQKGPKRTLKEQSGNLANKNNIKPIIKERGGELEIDIEVMEYYQYLDEGTKRIKNPWFLTDEFLRMAEFEDIMEDLYAAGLENTSYEILSTLK